MHICKAILSDTVANLPKVGNRATLQKNMPIPEKYLAEFEQSGIYHIYNRTNNNEKLFITNENRLFFLRKYKERLSFLVIQIMQQDFYLDQVK